MQMPQSNMNPENIRSENVIIELFVAWSFSQEQFYKTRH